MGKPFNFSKEQVLNAIKDSNTIISTIAKRLGCNWDTARKYIYKWKETQTAFENEREKALDFAESKLLKNIDKGEIAAIKYFLSKKGKDRGYGESLEEISATSDGSNNNIIKIVFDNDN